MSQRFQVQARAPCLHLYQNLFQPALLLACLTKGSLLKGCKHHCPFRFLCKQLPSFAATDCPVRFRDCWSMACQPVRNPVAPRHPQPVGPLLLSLFFSSAWRRSISSLRLCFCAFG